MSADRSDEEGSKCRVLLGAFGTNADSEKRKKAEQLASMVRATLAAGQRFGPSSSASG